MKITLKLNIGDFQNLDIESNDHKTKADCYEDIGRVLKDWEHITDNATALLKVFEVNIPDLEYPIEKLEITEEVVEKPKRLPKSTLQTDTETKEGTSISPPKKGKYTWYKVEGGGKVRKCNNEPCPYYLKYNEELGTYQHGKYDPNTKVWSYVDDNCEFYGG